MALDAKPCCWLSSSGMTVPPKLAVRDVNSVSGREDNAMSEKKNGNQESLKLMYICINCNYILKGTLTLISRKQGILL